MPKHLSNLYDIAILIKLCSKIINNHVREVITTHFKGGNIDKTKIIEALS